MAHRYAEIAFTETVKRLQEEDGSRKSYARLESGETSNDRLTEREEAFIAARDSFYMATVGETGWPYVQHRGGPPGFIRVLDGNTLVFPDFRGNRQLVTTGNLASDHRVSLIFVDYPNQSRLKLLGRANVTSDSDILQTVALPDYRARIERAFTVDVAAFDWNCPQHITPRYTSAEIERLNPMS